MHLDIENKIDELCHLKLFNFVNRCRPSTSSLYIWGYFPSFCLCPFWSCLVLTYSDHWDMVSIRPFYPAYYIDAIILVE